MSCDCQNFPPISLDRKSISKRIKESKALKKRMQVIEHDEQLAISLFRCATCGEMWQSGREWNFANEEYLFRVPPISEEEWRQEHYRQPAAMMIYSAGMETFYARGKMTISSSSCRTEGCTEPALSIGVLCEKHHIESLQKNRLLPSLPPGRNFPPYFEGRETPNHAAQTRSLARPV
jgi:hypothetical protein